VGIQGRGSADAALMVSTAPCLGLRSSAALGLSAALVLAASAEIGLPFL
jgi:hypothetical protein